MPHGRHARPEPELLPCYRPLIGGVRHRTQYRVRPPAGEYVKTLCEALHRVPAKDRRNQPHIYECHVCDEIAETNANDLTTESCIAKSNSSTPCPRRSPTRSPS